MRQVADITTHRPGRSRAYALSARAQPLAPADFRPAPTLLEEGDPATLQQTLTRGARMVYAATRAVPADIDSVEMV
jgi:hypothetical protein